MVLQQQHLFYPLILQIRTTPVSMTMVTRRIAPTALDSSQRLPVGPFLEAPVGACSFVDGGSLEPQVSQQLLPLSILGVLSPIMKTESVYCLLSPIYGEGVARDYLMISISI